LLETAPDPQLKRWLRETKADSEVRLTLLQEQALDRASKLILPEEELKRWFKKEKAELERRDEVIEKRKRREETNEKITSETIARARRRQESFARTAAKRQHLALTPAQATAASENLIRSGRKNGGEIAYFDHIGMVGLQSQVEKIQKHPLNMVDVSDTLYAKDTTVTAARASMGKDAEVNGRREAQGVLRNRGRSPSPSGRGSSSWQRPSSPGLQPLSPGQRELSPGLRELSPGRRTPSPGHQQLSGSYLTRPPSPVQVGAVGAGRGARGGQLQGRPQTAGPRLEKADRLGSVDRRGGTGARQYQGTRPEGRSTGRETSLPARGASRDMGGLLSAAVDRVLTTTDQGRRGASARGNDADADDYNDDGDDATGGRPRRSAHAPTSHTHKHRPLSAHLPVYRLPAVTTAATPSPNASPSLPHTAGTDTPPHTSRPQSNTTQRVRLATSKVSPEARPRTSSPSPPDRSSRYGSPSTPVHLRSKTGSDFSPIFTRPGAATAAAGAATVGTVFAAGTVSYSSAVSAVGALRAVSTGILPESPYAAAPRPYTADARLGSRLGASRVAVTGAGTGAGTGTRAGAPHTRNGSPVARGAYAGTGVEGPVPSAHLCDPLRNASPKSQYQEQHHSKHRPPPTAAPRGRERQKLEQMFGNDLIYRLDNVFFPKGHKTKAASKNTWRV
jgi:hypothetical protein